jgi:virulence-associated protein VapD
MLLVSIYTYLIDMPRLFLFTPAVKKSSAAAFRLSADYRKLQQRLARIGYLSQGSAIKRKPEQQGSRYIWTRKVQAKTVTVALSKEQYEWLRRAVSNRRKLERIVQEMQRCSRKILFETLPQPHRRKSLSRKVLGFI